jgi:hypothetical protein
LLLIYFLLKILLHCLTLKSDFDYDIKCIVDVSKYKIILG